MTYQINRKIVLQIAIGLLLLGCLAACQPLGQPANGVEAAPDSNAEPQLESNTVDTDSESTAPDTAGLQTFRIDESQSEARFHIDEDLRGERVTVVGVTSQVTGEIFLDPADPSTTQVGPIQVSARDLKTDSDRRNGAIQRFVLQSNDDAYEFITFTPTAIDGLPASTSVGDTFTFDITGDLTIRDHTQAETFTISVTANAEDEISGLGTATVTYADYGLFIPDVPFVANVADEVILEIDFVAVNAE